MDKLIGMPEPEKLGFFALPMMRGFQCEVDAPMMTGAASGRPAQGLGVGVSNIQGRGARFFVSVGNEAGSLVAMLDYARFVRLCELLAGAGKQAMLMPGVERPDKLDPLEALEQARPAFAAALLAYGENRVMTKEEAQGCADAFNAVEAALGIPQTENENG